MSTSLEIDFPPEVLLELHLTPEELARLLKQKCALAFFREGRLSSGLAALRFEERLPELELQPPCAE